MRFDVALSPAEFPGLTLDGGAAVVVDVLRATSTVLAACAAGCRRVIPVEDAATARARAAALPPGEALLAGERAGEPIAGFDLGNSPLEFTAERVHRRTIILTTTNGTAAMLAAAAAPVGAVAALGNLGALAGWLLEQERDVTVLCAGEQGAFSLEDAVCAGLLVGRLMDGAPAYRVTDAARAALRLGEHYGDRLDRLAEESSWARRLVANGRGADVAACLRPPTSEVVPRFDSGTIIPGPALTGLAGATHTRPGRKTGPEPTQ
ncbi:MAG TPA: 2-phosphosulfolactate phosphatase [Methylomirabilota bacterium]|nr:2-phosphosulfolactate phosphatase [Methylomirabilota bacterium]